MMNDLEAMTEYSEIRRRLFIVKNLLTIHITDKALIIEKQDLERKEAKLKPIIEEIKSKMSKEVLR